MHFGGVSSFSTISTEGFVYKDTECYIICNEQLRIYEKFEIIGIRKSFFSHAQDFSVNQTKYVTKRFCLRFLDLM